MTGRADVVPPARFFSYGGCGGVFSVVGRDDSARQTTCKNGGPRASPAQRVAWGEDEQGSGVRNARQGVLNGADFARTTKPVSFSLLEKERFLESKEKGAPEWVEWLQIGIRRPIFTPPLSTGTVHR